ncbi:hypothetical protein KY320_00330, partial [Candidatus Woesearchaeota archaeon]|nr:hypothetical protein [Candidatus Woesearchaeota archaeon]
TITDLQTFLIVKERLKDSQDHLDQSKKDIINRQDRSAISNLAFAIERLNSARSWSEFFGRDGKQFIMDNESLQRFCLDKIAEAEERVQYASSFFVVPLSEISKELDVARQNFEEQDYELCIFRAAQVKARTNLILSSVGVQVDEIDLMLERKQDVAKRAIIKETERNIFPILGYSYYEYSLSLSENDKFSALLYAELALEHSNFDLYFGEEKRYELPRVEIGIVLVFIGGLIFGVILTLLFFKPERDNKKVKKKLSKRK